MTRALVTGAAKRLGRAMALELADQGYDVAVHYGQSAEAAEDVAELIRAKGRRAATVQADLTAEDDMQRLVPAAAEALEGPLTCLVNNASIFEYDTLASATRDSWDRHMDCNLRAPFVLTQAFARAVPAPVRDEDGRATAQGLVINLIDQRVRKLTPDFTSYTLSKAALWSLTQTLAQALAPAIRVNAIGPGPTLQGARQGADDFLQQQMATILERGSNPDDIIGALRYFLTAPGVTGQLICTDGGQHLAWKTPDVEGVE